MKQAKTKYATERVNRTKGICRLAERTGVSRNTLWKGINDPEHASARTRRALRKAGLWPASSSGKSESESPTPTLNSNSNFEL